MADTLEVSTVTDTTAPIETGERAAIARLLEASRDALTDPRLRLLDRRELAGHMASMLDRAALDVRRGYREADLNTLTGDLDRFREELASKSVAPERNPADPYTTRGES